MEHSLPCPWERRHRSQFFYGLRFFWRFPRFGTFRCLENISPSSSSTHQAEYHYYYMIRTDGRVYHATLFLGSLHGMLRGLSGFRGLNCGILRDVHWFQDDIFRENSVIFRIECSHFKTSYFAEIPWHSVWCTVISRKHIPWNFCDIL